MIYLSDKTDYKWELILYPDSESYDHFQVLECIEEKVLEYAYIFHDKDIKEDGTPKKPHYHVYLSFGADNPRTKEFVLYLAGLPAGYTGIKYVRSWKKAIRYLLHLDDPSKFQYDPADVISNFDVSTYFKKQDDDLQAMKIYNYIKNSRSPPSVQSVLSWSLENGCYAAFRRGFSVWSSLLREINNHFYSSFKYEHLKEKE